MRFRDITQRQQRRRPAWPGTAFFALLAGVATIVVLVRRGYIHYDQRAFNKRILNPLMLRLAGRMFVPQAIIHHHGRKSGRAYATPIVVEPITGGFIIPLPYGADVDWCRNILAAGQCTIRWHGTTYAAVVPTVLDVQSVAPAISPLRQRAFQIIGTKQVLKVQITHSLTTPVTSGW